MSVECSNPEQRPKRADLNDALFRAFFDAAGDAVMLADDDRRYVDVNPAACELLGISRAELIGRRIDDFFIDDSAGAWSDFREDGAHRGRGRVRRAGGELRHVEWNATADVVPGLHMSILRDVTATVEAQRQLAASAETYRTLFDASPQPMFVYDRHTLQIIGVNEAAEQQYGYSSDEFRNLTVLDIRPPEDHKRLLDHLATGDTRRRSGPWRHVRKDGSVIEVEVTSAPITIDGRAAYIAIVSDVTDRMAVERRLSESEARYRSIFETANEGIATIDAESRIVLANPRMADMLGYTVEELIGRVAMDLVAPEDLDKAFEIRERLRSDDPGPVEFRLRRSDGRSVYCRRADVHDARTEWRIRRGAGHVHGCDRAQGRDSGSGRQRRTISQRV